MKKLTFLHTADLHLDSPFIGLKNLPNSIFTRLRESTFTSFQRIIDIAIEKNVDFIIIAGDLYDQEDRSIKAQTRLRSEMERLHAHRIQVYIIHGNHDHEGGNWIKLEWPENVHVFSNNEVERKTFMKDGHKLASLYGFSYGQKAVTDNMIHQFQKNSESVFHIGIHHGSVEGNVEHNHYAPFKLSELIEKGFDYWALGHIHKQQILSEHPLIMYPGNIQGRNKKETGQKGCYAIELTEAGSSYTFFPTAEIVWETMNITIDELENMDQLIALCYQAINDIRDEKRGTFLAITFCGSSSISEEIGNEDVLDDFMQILNEDEEQKNNFVWISEIKNETVQAYDKEQLKAEGSFMGDLLSIIASYENYEQAYSPIFSHQQARKYLEMFTDDELKKMKEEAEKLLIHELLQSRSS